MNDKTKLYYNIARMYAYAKDICDICQQCHFNYENIIANMVTKHAVNMCIVQMGEHANRIKGIDENFYYNSGLHLSQIKGMRDRITHSYGDIDYKIVRDVLKNGVPDIKNSIESMVHPDVLNNPYCLYENEYDELSKGFSERLTSSQHGEEEFDDFDYDER